MVKKKSVHIGSRKVDFYFDAEFGKVDRLVDSQVVFLTDENIFKAHKAKFRNRKVIVIPPGEHHKNQETVNRIIHDLIEMGADRQTWLVGVGGGVVTDLAGFVASVYMRGIRFGFIPTSILAMVDASIGGKNGIDIGQYKNLLGTINQPTFLLYDFSLLKSLPAREWTNGFAEIIKHACIKDAAMFEMLEKVSPAIFKKEKQVLSEMIIRNVMIKSRVVQKDEFENGDRRLLNFGHTLGHAIETRYSLSHGEAVAIGMVAACRISGQLTGFQETGRVVRLLKKYKLPVQLEFDRAETLKMMQMDKKNARAGMRYILLKKTGKGIVQTIPHEKLAELIKNF